MSAGGASGAGTLVRCFEPCFLEVLGALDAAGEAGSETDAAALRGSVMARLDECVLAASGSSPVRTTVLARRFVTAWADERLVRGDWPGRDDWRARPLQSDWGEGRTAGEWFFEALAGLDAARADDAAPAALALRCLALTFDGRMHRSPQELLDLRRDTARRFSLFSPPAAFPPSPFPPSSAARAGKRGGAWRRLRWWLPPLAAAVLLLAAWRFADRDLDAYLERIAVCGPGQ